MSKPAPELIGAQSALLGLPTEDILDVLITLTFLRQLFDPRMPTIAGHDPRTVVRPTMPWWRQVADADRRTQRAWLDALTMLLNMHPLIGGRLAQGWRSLDGDAVAGAVEHINRWTPSPACGGDALGELLQAVRGAGNGAGDIFTPYHLRKLMAELNPPQPGETISDPCCGSGRMLLAAVEVCRKLHGHDQVPNLVAVATDGTAVRVARLNMVLAGLDSSYGPHYSAPVSAAAAS